MHNVKDSTENYLEALYILSLQTGHVRSVDIANRLELSRASVSKAVKKLEEEGHLIMESDGELVLTESGLAIGRNIDEKHRALKQLLIHMGVSDGIAEEDACKIEHALSDETFDCLKAYLKTL